MDHRLVSVRCERVRPRVRFASTCSWLTRCGGFHPMPSRPLATTRSALEESRCSPSFAASKTEKAPSSVTAQRRPVHAWPGARRCRSSRRRRSFPYSPPRYRSRPPKLATVAVGAEAGARARTPLQARGRPAQPIRATDSTRKARRVFPRTRTCRNTRQRRCGRRNRLACKRSWRPL